MADSRCPTCGALGFGPLPCPNCDLTRDKHHRVALAGAAAIVAIALAGCSIMGRGEQPTDFKIAGVHWYVDRPDFVMSEGARARHEIQWNVVPEDPNVSLWTRRADAMDRLRALCGYDDPRWSRMACTFRIQERAQCVVFSLLTKEEAARYVLNVEGDDLYTHELRHCGIGMPVAAGWTHREGRP